MAAEKKSPGREKVAAVVGGALDALKFDLARKQIIWPAKGGAYDGIMPGEWRHHGDLDETKELPADCPVKPLGYDGENNYFIDTAGQVFNTGDKALGVERMQKLFAGQEDFLCWAWPSWSGSGDKKYVSNWKTEEARKSLFAACRARGPWSPTDMVRGRGAWRGSDGELVLHCGEFLVVDGQMLPTGERGDHFYVRRPKMISPWAHEVSAEANPAVELFRLLLSWNWVRGRTDAMLMLGWIGVALYGAALDWRPSAFVIGDRGTGKSELVKLLKVILGRGMISTTNATSAGLYQLVQHDALPISIDELEGEDAPEQSQQIIKMARDAASGSVRIRGGQNHQGVEFAARSSFLFSAINPPPINAASLSRLVLLQLRPIKDSSAPSPVLRAADTVGPMLLRRLADGWAGFGKLKEQYDAVLRANGHDSRGQDTFGTFLAAAHTLLGNEGLEALHLPFESLDPWGFELRSDAAPEVSGGQPNWAKCIEEIMTAQVDTWNKGERRQVGQVLEEFMAARDGTFTLAMLNTALAPADLAVIDAGIAAEGLVLAVPHRGKGIAGLLRDTAYASGRGAEGSWRYALGQGPDHIVLPQIPSRRGDSEFTNRISIAGTQRRCSFISIKDLREWQDKQA